MEQLLYSVSEYKILAGVIAFLVTAIESFIPILPLVAIILLNVFLFGMWIGFFISWAASSSAAVILYVLASKFSKLKIFDKYRQKFSDKKIFTYIKKQGFSIIFITYVCPFISDFLINILSGFVNLDIKTFISGMLVGKFVMFLFISYVGNDVQGFFQDPIKVILLSMFILISWMIGRNMNNKIHINDDK